MAKLDFEKMDMASLKAETEKLRKRALDLRFEHALGKLIDTSALKKNRRDLARAMTRLKGVEK